ncbi:AAA family ATPase [Virgibacillus pantothenticus]|uniref:AAA family ATPase n=1 Tax=Virgibacillus pantothenticus TaxID=1473 RepID=UPI00281628AD|nr:AAA family ATPase [Virgibacillus pantothenticus]MEB5453555.1 AAA family ATPase [Virgibacillus pantothenticus]MEB5457753.1 AAA family ATPase [Virgibacillus pantothenticus]MEB5461918.1 AAA family ATPase [Virgibacillus pantothenticus]MEB5466027.1 AAA family ATPase [Virgibacillus pantothenticus]MEB5470371.1 AAA family ATPase [Virgibacillus pantothenticus]
MNIILGEKRQSNDETNGVGKSTMIDCISFLLGKSIPKYYQNNGDILDKNIYIVLKVCTKGTTHFLSRSFNNPRNGFLLENVNKFSMDISEWKKVSLTTFKNYVENLILTEKEENITFAALREYIMRDEKNGFNDILLPNRNGLRQYRYLNYLFTLPNKTEFEIKTFRDRIEEMNNQIKIIESMNINIADLKVEEEVIDQIDELDKAIKKAKTVSHFKNSTKDYTLIKKELNDVQNKIFEYEHIRSQYQKI